jgi:hypothetical protein
VKKGNSRELALPIRLPFHFFTFSPFHSSRHRYQYPHPLVASILEEGQQAAEDEDD